MASERSQLLKSYALPLRDARAARESSAALAGFAASEEQPITLRLLDPRTGKHIETTIASAAVQLLTHALAEMAEGHAVTLVPLDAELGTQQAADLLGVSRPYFVKLLEEGRIPFRKIGTRRRVRGEALRRYVAEYQQEAGEALSAIADESQRLSLYE